MKHPSLCRFCHKPTANISRICTTCWRLSAPLRDPSERGAKAWLEWKRKKMAKVKNAQRVDQGFKLAELAKQSRGKAALLGARDRSGKGAL